MKREDMESILSNDSIKVKKKETASTQKKPEKIGATSKFGSIVQNLIDDEEEDETRTCVVSVRIKPSTRKKLMGIQMEFLERGKKYSESRILADIIEKVI